MTHVPFSARQIIQQYCDEKVQNQFDLDSDFDEQCNKVSKITPTETHATLDSAKIYLMRFKNDVYLYRVYQD